MPRFTLNKGLTDTYGTWSLRDRETAFSTYGSDADAIELRDLLLREFPLDAQPTIAESTSAMAGGLKRALQIAESEIDGVNRAWDNAIMTVIALIEKEINGLHYRSSYHDRWDP